MRPPRREGAPPLAGDVIAALRNAVRLRCPRCGLGALFPGALTPRMNETCPICHLRFDRGNGYFTGALAMNLLLAEFVATAAWIPFAIDRTTPIWIAYAVGVSLSIGLPILGFRHTRAFWIALDRLINPVS